MSDITDWEPEMKSEHDFKSLYAQQVELNQTFVTDNKELRLKNVELIKKNALLLSDHKELTDKFTCLKADSITTLKAIDLCILATLNTEKQHLTHRARNFRMRHVHQIISNQIDAFCDRKLTNYEDDF